MAVRFDPNPDCCTLSRPHGFHILNLHRLLNSHPATLNMECGGSPPPLQRKHDHPTLCREPPKPSPQSARLNSKGAPGSVSEPGSCFLLPLPARTPSHPNSHPASTLTPIPTTNSPTINQPYPFRIICLQIRPSIPFRITSLQKEKRGDPTLCQTHPVRSNSMQGQSKSIPTRLNKSYLSHFRETNGLLYPY
jgi:hypothetical protein